MTDEKPKCKAMMNIVGIGLGRYANGTSRGWRCHYNASRDGYCGIHHPDVKAARRKKRGPTKRERAEERQKRLDAVLKAARGIASRRITGPFTDRLRKALADYDRGEK